MGFPSCFVGAGGQAVCPVSQADVHAFDGRLHQLREAAGFGAVGLGGGIVHKQGENAGKTDVAGAACKLPALPFFDDVAVVFEGVEQVGQFVVSCVDVQPEIAFAQAAAVLLCAVKQQKDGGDVVKQCLRAAAAQEGEAAPVGEAGGKQGAGQDNQPQKMQPDKKYGYCAECAVNQTVAVETGEIAGKAPFGGFKQQGSGKGASGGVAGGNVAVGHDAVEQPQHAAVKQKAGKGFGNAKRFQAA